MTISEKTTILKKVKTYIGFAIKSNSAVYGAENIIKVKKTKLVLISKALKDNSLKKLFAHINVNSISYMILDTEIFDEIVAKIGVKALGIKNENLCEAILSYLKDINNI